MRWLGRRLIVRPTGHCLPEVEPASCLAFSGEPAGWQIAAQDCSIGGLPTTAGHPGALPTSIRRALTSAQLVADLVWRRPPTTTCCGRSCPQTLSRLERSLCGWLARGSAWAMR